MDEDQKKLLEEVFGGEHKPSFAKMLYMGAFDGERVFPFPAPSKEVINESEAFIQKLNAFCDEHLDPDAIDRNAEIPDSVIKGLGKLGVLGMTIPKEYGGLGLSNYAYCRAEEELARRCASTALLVNAHQSIGLKSLLLFGTEKQRQQWLPPLAKGEFIAAFSLTEPNAGSDAGGLESRAVYDPEKKVYRITGEKQWTTNGSIADLLTVMARTEVDGEDKITAFLVTPDMPGFKIKDAALEKVGMRGTKTANLTLDNVEVPEENVLGPVGKGLRVALTLLDYGRTTFGATCTGSSKELYERALEHAKTRHQFKRPLASFGLVKEKLTRSASLIYAMDAMTYMTAGLADRGQEDIMLESAMLKVFASDAQWQILYDTMQIFGGRSFFTDQPFERMMRDSRLNLIGEGSNEVMRAFIGAAGMRDIGMALKEGVDALKSPTSIFSGMRTLLNQTIFQFKKPTTAPIRHSVLESDAIDLQERVQRFGKSILSLLTTYGEEVIEHQLDLDRVATAAMNLYGATAVLSKLDHRLDQTGGNPDSLGNEWIVGRHYMQMAFDAIDLSLDTLFDKRDKKIEEVSDTLTNLKPVHV